MEGRGLGGAGQRAGTGAWGEEWALSCGLSPPFVPIPLRPHPPSRIPAFGRVQIPRVGGLRSKTGGPSQDDQKPMGPPAWRPAQVRRLSAGLSMSPRSLQAAPWEARAQ